MAKKQDVHREWFRTVSKTVCPTCGRRKTVVWTWGEYVTGKWYNVAQFCDGCALATVGPRLIAHARSCGCTFALVGYRGEQLSAPLVALQAEIDRRFTVCPAGKEVAV